MGVAAGCLPDSEGGWNKSRTWEVSMEAREALSVFTTAFATSSLKRCRRTPGTHRLFNHYCYARDPYNFKEALRTQEPAETQQKTQHVQLPPASPSKVSKAF